VEKPTSLRILRDTWTKGNLDYIVDLCESTHASNEELFHFKKAQASICL
jgi:hypothetical protein